MQYVKLNTASDNMEFIINRNIGNIHSPITIVEVGHSFPNCGKTADSVTSCYQLHFTVSGNGIFRGQEISSGKGFLVLPGEAQDMKVTSEGFEQYWINFDGTDIRNILYDCGIPIKSHMFDFLCKESGESLETALFGNIFPKHFDGSTCLPQHSHTYLTGLLYQLFSVIEREKSTASSLAEKYATTVCSYIRSHYAEPLSVDWLSAIVGLSPKYLIRIFKSVCGCTIFEYIAKVGNIPERDMFNTFNMGVGMSVTVAKEDAQKAVEIQEMDTPEVLQKRVMEQAEWIILPKATEMVCSDIISKRG